jgi:hypothetical protein
MYLFFSIQINFLAFPLIFPAIWYFIFTFAQFEKKLAFQVVLLPIKKSQKIPTLVWEMRKWLFEFELVLVLSNYKKKNVSRIRKKTFYLQFCMGTPEGNEFAG